MKSIVNIDRIRQVNTATVYRLIDQQGPISRVQIAEQCQLAAGSVTKLTRQLLEAGLISEADQQASTGGRRATSLQSELRNFHFVSLRLGRGTLDLALYDLSGQLHTTEQISIHEREQDELVERLIRETAAFIEQISGHITLPAQLIALAVTLPGLINADEQIVSYTPHFALRNCPLGSLLEQAFEMPVYLGNDTRAMALAEHYFGASQDCLDSVLISVHGGTGAGIIINGEVFRGQGRDVGEIGHIQVDPLGDKCHCGNSGCLETVASNSAIVNRVRQLIEQGVSSRLDPQQLTIESICQAALAGDLPARQVLIHVGTTLGRAVAIAINLLHPQKILLSGEIMAASELVLPAIEQSVRHQALASFRENLQIEAAALQDRPTAGGLALVKRALLEGDLLLQLIENEQSPVSGVSR